MPVLTLTKPPSFLVRLIAAGGRVAGEVSLAPAMPPSALLAISLGGL
jgi:hypothetical protein